METDAVNQDSPKTRSLRRERLVGLLSSYYSRPDGQSHTTLAAVTITSHAELYVRRAVALTSVGTRHPCLRNPTDSHSDELVYHKAPSSVAPPTAKQFRSTGSATLAGDAPRADAIVAQERARFESRPPVMAFVLRVRHGFHAAARVPSTSRARHKPRTGHQLSTREREGSTGET